MINNFSSVSLIRYDFNGDGFLMMQNILIILHSFLGMFRDPVKLW